MNKKPILPDFDSDEAFAEWMETHDTSDILEQWEEVELPFKMIRSSFRPNTSPVNLRIQTDLLQAIKTMADQRGIPYQMLIRQWLMDKLQQEAPDLVPIKA